MLKAVGLVAETHFLVTGTQEQEQTKTAGDILMEGVVSVHHCYFSHK